VQKDGWEKAAVANVWSALMSEGFFLLKSANNLLLSTAGAAGKGGGREEARAERAEAIKALLIALARFEAVQRLFGGSCYNTDLPRNLGVPVQHACTHACVRVLASASRPAQPRACAISSLVLSLLSNTSGKRLCVWQTSVQVWGTHC